jgi:hypothetical protein
MLAIEDVPRRQLPARTTADLMVTWQYTHLPTSQACLPRTSVDVTTTGRHGSTISKPSGRFVRLVQSDGLSWLLKTRLNIANNHKIQHFIANSYFGKHTMMYASIATIACVAGLVAGDFVKTVSYADSACNDIVSNSYLYGTCVTTTYASTQTATRAIWLRTPCSSNLAEGCMCR